MADLNMVDLTSGFLVVSFDHCKTLGEACNRAWSMTVCTTAPLQVIAFVAVDSTGSADVITVMKALRQRLALKEAQVIICLDNMPHKGLKPVSGPQDERCKVGQIVDAAGAITAVQDMMHVQKSASDIGLNNTHTYNTDKKVRGIYQRIILPMDEQIMAFI